MVISKGVALHNVRMAILPTSAVLYEDTYITIGHTPIERTLREKLFQKTKRSP